jgi:hypothetical protein
MRIVAAIVGGTMPRRYHFRAMVGVLPKLLLRFSNIGVMASRLRWWW